MGLAPISGRSWSHPSCSPRAAVLASQGCKGAVTESPPCLLDHKPQGNTGNFAVHVLVSDTPGLALLRTLSARSLYAGARRFMWFAQGHRSWVVELGAKPSFARPHYFFYICAIAWTTGIMWHASAWLLPVLFAEHSIFKWTQMPCGQGIWCGWANPTGKGGHGSDIQNPIFIPKCAVFFANVIIHLKFKHHEILRSQNLYTFSYTVKLPCQLIGPWHANIQLSTWP